MKYANTSEKEDIVKIVAVRLFANMGDTNTFVGIVAAKVSANIIVRDQNVKIVNKNETFHNTL